MFSLHEVITQFTLFGAGLCFIMALEQLASRERGQVNCVSALLLVCNGIVALNAASFANGVPLREPLSMFLFITSIFLVGPLNLFYYDSLVNPRGIPLRRLLAHAVPAMAVLGIEIFFQLLDTGIKQALVAEALGSFSLNAFTALVLLSALHAFSYFVYLVRVEVSLWGDRAIREEMMLVSAANAMAVVCGACLLAGFVSGNTGFYLAAGATTMVIHIAIFIEHGRSPHFFKILKHRIRERRYLNSTLRGMSPDTLLERLAYLMEKERIFTDYELTLQKLAALLAIKPHQLSELINDRMGVNFQALVNGYRVREATRLIAEDPDRSIISICFHVGFSTKSAFNRAFKRFTGKNPLDFRAGDVSRTDVL